MSARAVWKGSLSVGLVTVPVAAYKATDEGAGGARTTWLHAACHTPINQHKVCACCAAKPDAPADVHNLSMDAIVNGVKDADGTFVVISKEDLAGIKVPSCDTIAVEAFVPVADIDPVYVAATYYLGPALAKQAAVVPAGYALLRDAMRASGVAMTGRVSLYGKEHPVAVRPFGPVLALDLLRTVEEVRALDGLPSAEAAEPTLAADQLGLMQQLIGMYAGTFDPAAYEDGYAKAFAALVARKRAGAEPVAEVAAPAPVAAPVDVMAALAASLAVAKPTLVPKVAKVAKAAPAKVATPRRRKAAAEPALPPAA